jgi:hypothetical protein
MFFVTYLDPDANFRIFYKLQLTKILLLSHALEAIQNCLSVHGETDLSWQPQCGVPHTSTVYHANTTQQDQFADFYMIMELGEAYLWKWLCTPKKYINM